MINHILAAERNRFKILHIFPTTRVFALPMLRRTMNKKGELSIQIVISSKIVKTANSVLNLASSKCCSNCNWRIALTCFQKNSLKKSNSNKKNSSNKRGSH